MHPGPRWGWHWARACDALGPLLGTSSVHPALSSDYPLPGEVLGVRLEMHFGHRKIVEPLDQYSSSTG
jgi:hypothetical protein